MSSDQGPPDPLQLNDVRGLKRKAVEITNLEGETETLEIMPLGVYICFLILTVKVRVMKSGGLAF